MASAYCLRCKRRSSTRNVRVITTRNGRKRITGNCHRCGTRVSKFVGGRQSGRGLHDRIMFTRSSRRHREKSKNHLGLLKRIDFT